MSKVVDYETVWVVTQRTLSLDPRALQGLPPDYPGSFPVDHYAPGDVLPETTRPDYLAHLEANQLAIPVHVPITDRSNA